MSACPDIYTTVPQMIASEEMTSMFSSNWLVRENFGSTITDLQETGTQEKEIAVLSPLTSSILILQVTKSLTGEVIVSDNFLNLYGIDLTQEGAVSEYMSMLQDLFTELQESEENLSRDLHEKLDFMRSILAT
jgi:hypothetical protein